MSPSLAKHVEVELQSRHIEQSKANAKEVIVWAFNCLRLELPPAPHASAKPAGKAIVSPMVMQLQSSDAFFGRLVAELIAHVASAPL
eukprot:3026761-Amphidinium_carterae.1